MPTATATTLFEQEFLPIRAKLLEVAASLDRLDRAAGPLPDDVRMSQLRQAIEVLLQAEAGRAERIQLTFSLPYDEAWQKEFTMTE